MRDGANSFPRIGRVRAPRCLDRGMLSTGGGGGGEVEGSDSVANDFEVITSLARLGRKQESDVHMPVIVGVEILRTNITITN